MDKNRVSLIIKTTKGESCDISVPEDSTIEELKCLISLKFDIPVENQRLIHSGRILDDEKTIDDYKLVDGQQVHLFRIPDSSTTTTNINNNYQNDFSNTNNMFYQNPFTFPCFGGGNTSNQFGSGFDLDMLLNNPFIQSIFESTDFFELIINSNPQIKRMVEEHPELGNAIRDPATIKQAIEIMKNPNLMREMARSTDRAMANIETHPEGFRYLTKMFANENDYLYSDNDYSSNDDVNSIHDTAPEPNTRPLPNP